MADYLTINPHGKNGKLAISRVILETLAKDATAKVDGVSLVKESKTVKAAQVTFQRNGQVKIVVNVKLAKSVNEEVTIKVIKDYIVTALVAYAESVPFEVDVKISEKAE